jgi:hypothetical protein
VNRLGLIAGAALLLGASQAQADSLRPALHWSRGLGAEGCIDPRGLAERVQQLTGPVIVDAARAELSIEAHVDAPAPARFEVRVSATRGDGVPRGTRTLSHHGPDCRALDDAIVFVIAVLIDPDLTLAELPAAVVALGAEGQAPEAQLLAELDAAPQVPAPVSAPAPDPAPPSRPPARPPEEPSGRGAFGVRGGLAMSALLLPRAALGVSVATTYGLVRNLVLELQLQAASMLGGHEVDAGRAVTARSYAAALFVCPQRAWGRVRLAVCTGPDVTLVYARGQGFSADRGATLASYGVSAAPALAIRLRRRWWLEVRAGARVAVNRVRFEATRAQGSPRSVFDVARVAPIASFSLGLEF